MTLHLGLTPPLFSTKNVLYEYQANNDTCFSHFLSMFQAIAREYFQGACDHFLVTIYNLSEVGSEH